MKRYLLSVLFLSVLSSVGFSIPVCDLAPPSWDRSAINATWGAWSFDAPNNSENPPYDFGNNPNGTTTMTIVPAPTHTWLPIYDGQQGVWPLSGQIAVTIPNTPYDPTKIKIIRIQLVWQGRTASDDPIIWVVDDRNLSQNVPLIRDTSAGNWKAGLYEIVWPYNPYAETVNIGGSIYVDCLTIDTICIPEPATLAVMGIGALVVLTRKSKRIA